MYVVQKFSRRPSHYSVVGGCGAAFWRLRWGLVEIGVVVVALLEENQNYVHGIADVHLEGGIPTQLSPYSSTVLLLGCSPSL